MAVGNLIDFGEEAFSAGLLAGEIIQVAGLAENAARKLAVSARANPGRAPLDYRSLRDMTKWVGRLMGEFERLRTTEEAGDDRVRSAE